MQNQKISFAKTGKIAFSLLVIFLFSWQVLLAQVSPDIGVQYDEDLNRYFIPSANVVREMTIEAQPAYKRLYFVARGADGGFFNCEGTSCEFQKAGSGALVQAVFEIGDQANQIPPLSTIRMITGIKGESQHKKDGGDVGGGGGGGTGVLFLRPGGNPSNAADWTILLAAGGGGGAAFDSAGGNASDSANSSGTGGEQHHGGGGGGAFENGGPENGGLNNGRLGLPDGGNGGTGSNKGGWGFGGGGSGGGSGDSGGGGGGGGGYSGGGGGKQETKYLFGNIPAGHYYYGGGGGGSYVHPMAIYSSVERNGTTSDPKSGVITVQGFNTVGIDQLDVSFLQENGSPLQMVVSIDGVDQWSSQFMRYFGNMYQPANIMMTPGQPAILLPGLYILTITDNKVPNHWNQLSISVAVEPDRAIAIFDEISTTWDDKIRYGDATVKFFTTNERDWKFLLDKKSTAASPYRTGYSGLFKSLSTDEYTLTIVSTATNEEINKKWTFNIGAGE